MNTSGFNYFVDLAGVSNKLAILYAFSGSGFQHLPSVSYANNLYSGRIQNTGNFHQPNRSGSGFFDGSNFVNISNASGLNSETSWTTIINYEISGGQSSILFSSFSSGLVNSGYAIGINSNSQPFVEYYTSNGPAILMSENTYGTKNSLWVTKTQNNISIEYLNLNNKQFESESFTVDDNFWTPSNVWLIGNKTGAPSYFSGNGLVGYVDLFAHFNSALLTHEKNLLKSGIYSNIAPANYYITTGTVSGITGFINYSYPVYTGITGFQNILSGYFTGNCNQIDSIYYSGNLTGTIMASGISGIYQTIITTFTGNSGVQIIENSGYSMSFGMEAISYLQNISAGDFSELYYYPNSTNKTNINNELAFDRTLNKFVSPIVYDTNQLNFYTNSVSQFGSGYSVTGGFYNLGIQISGMYFSSGNYLSGDYDGSDTNILDIISGSRSFARGIDFNNLVIDFNNTIITFNDNYYIFNNETGISGLIQNKSMVFAEGVKLVSGIDYGVSGNNFIFTNPYIYNNITAAQIWTFPQDLENSYYSGIWNNYSGQKFARGTSQLYLNGLRQSLVGQEYTEISKFSLLNNSGRYLDNLSYIYSNENDWVEYL